MGKGRGRGALVVVVREKEGNGEMNRLDGTDLLLFFLGTPILYDFAVV